MADDRTYIKVHDGIEDHPKVAPLSDRAFRLLVTTWGWCSKHLTDGMVPNGVWNKRGTPAARRELVEAGLVETRPDHVLMHDYLEHQRSAEEVAEVKQRKHERAAKANHARWHTGKSGTPKSDCPYCVQEGLLQGSNKESLGDPFQSTETETETDKKKTRVRADPDGFEEFYAAYPKHVARGAAVKAYAKAVEQVGKEVLLEGAKRYARVKRGSDPQFVKAPATWLNQECWLDEDDRRVIPMNEFAGLR